MSSSRIRAHAPRQVTPPDPVVDESIVEAYLEDSSGVEPGRAAGVVRAHDEAEAAAFLRATVGSEIRVLPQAARSSVTGGAVPRGEVVVSVEAFNEIGPVERRIGGGRVRAGAGVRLIDLQRHVAGHDCYYPPVPTYQEAMIGGTASTNAGGPATFKYGVTREWVHGLRVLLFNGDVLEIERGQTVAEPGEDFVVVLSDGTELHVPVPGYRLPPLKKISAGYYASDPLDLIDLFVGSEGTLGLITEVTVDLVTLPSSVVTGLVFLKSTRAALELGDALRAAAASAWSTGDPLGPEIRAIEIMDGNSLDLLREHGDTSRLRVRVPEHGRAALLFETELPERLSNDDAQEILGRFLEEQTAGEDGPLLRLFSILGRHGALDDLDFAFPEDRARAAALHEFRESIPKRVNEILGGIRKDHPSIKKVGGDLIVPVDRLAEMMRFYEEGFARRGLDFVIWGHLSDGNLHPNAIPRDDNDVATGLEALLEFADEAVRLGGCPLSEHGVGRNPIKQEMLRRFLGDDAIAAMRAVKGALDPEARFAPGVLFTP
jgi:D-lactate dehydrogenase (cytochrome)